MRSFDCVPSAYGRLHFAQDDIWGGGACALMWLCIGMAWLVRAEMPVLRGRMRAGMPAVRGNSNVAR